LKTILIGLALSLAVAAAPLACPTDTADTYNDLSNTGGCTLGSGPNQLTLTEFSWTSAKNGFFVFADPVNVTIAPVFNLGGTFLGFSFSGNFSVPADKELSATMRYVIDPPPPIIDGFGAFLDPTGYGKLSGTVLYGTKTGVQTIPPVLNSLQFSKDGIGVDLFFPAQNQIQPLPPSNYLDVTLKIQIGTGPGGAASSSQGGAAYFTTSESVGPNGAVPEPAAFGLVGAGLLGVAALSRRRSA